MTATLAASTAALKVLYPKGEMPKSINDMFVGLKRLKKDTNFVGELAYVPLQNANPQGSSAVFSRAQADVYQGNYVRFGLTRVKHYGIARVDGETAEAAVADEGAMVDLWDNETKGVAVTEMSCLATYLYGSGDGVLGRNLSGHAGVTLTMYVGTNMNYFSLNQTVKGVDATGLSSTVHSGTARIIGIDRVNRTLTTTAAWDSLISSLADGDYLVRDSDHHASGVASVITGWDEYIKGGSSAPGTLFGLNRNPDPTALAGSVKDYAGWAPEDAIADASAVIGQFGLGSPKLLVCHPLELATMKRSIGSKLVYNRPGGDEAKANFSDVSVHGENGLIEILADPFAPRNKAFLVSIDKFSLFSLKAAPHIAQLDDNRILRLTDADTYEIRFAFYGQLKCKDPGPHIKLTSFCA